MINPLSASPPRWLRITALLIGIIVLLWLPFEDTRVVLPLLLAGALCAWWAARFLLLVRAGQPGLIWRYLVVGASAGLAVTPLAWLLMIFKNGFHSHAQPDFTFVQMQYLFTRAPIWIAGGALVCLGIGLARAARS